LGDLSVRPWNDVWCRRRTSSRDAAYSTGVMVIRYPLLFIAPIAVDDGDNSTSDLATSVRRIAVQQLKCMINYFIVSKGKRLC
jgi:hypothetical protein